MSDYAPRHFAIEWGHYECMKKLLEKKSNPPALETEICRWFCKPYSSNMKLGYTLQEKKAAIKEKVLNCIENYKAASPLDIPTCEQLWYDLKEIVLPAVKMFSDKPLNLKHRPQTDQEKEAGNKREVNRLPGDIQAMLKVLDLPYTVKKRKGAKQNDQSTWRYDVLFEESSE